MTLFSTKDHVARFDWFKLTGLLRQLATRKESVLLTHRRQLYSRFSFPSVTKRKCAIDAPEEAIFSCFFPFVAIISITLFEQHRRSSPIKTPKCPDDTSPARFFYQSNARITVETEGYSDPAISATTINANEVSIFSCFFPSYLRDILVRNNCSIHTFIHPQHSLFVSLIQCNIYDFGSFFAVWAIRYSSQWVIKLSVLELAPVSSECHVCVCACRQAVTSRSTQGQS